METTFISYLKEIKRRAEIVFALTGMNKAITANALPSAECISDRVANQEQTIAAVLWKESKTVLTTMMSNNSLHAECVQTAMKRSCEENLKNDHLMEIGGAWAFPKLTKLIEKKKNKKIYIMHRNQFQSGGLLKTAQIHMKVLKPIYASKTPPLFFPDCIAKSC